MSEGKGGKGGKGGKEGGPSGSRYEDPGADDDGAGVADFGFEL